MTRKPFNATRSLIRAEAGLWKKPVMWIAALGLALVPLINCMLFVGSMWDPYGNLGNLPAGVVSLDQGTLFRDKEYRLGDQLSDELKAKKTLGFIFYKNEAEAREALKEGKIYLVLVVPPEFSKLAVEGKPDQPGKIRMILSEGLNFFATSVARAAGNTVAQELNVQLSKGRWEAVGELAPKLTEGFTAIHEALDTINTGARTLSAASGQLADGIDTLDTGLQAADKGARGLADGSTTLGAGVRKLTDGMATLAKGMDTLAKAAPGEVELQPLRDGMASLNQGLKTLSDGLSAIDTGALELKSGSGKLADGAWTLAGATKINALAPAALKDATTSLAVGSKKIAEGSSLLGESLDKAAHGSRDLSTGAGRLEDGIESLVEGNIKIKSALLTIQAALPAGTDLARLAQGSKDLETGAVSLALGLDKLKAGSSRLRSSGRELAAGAGRLSAGIQTLKDKVPTAMDVSLGDTSGFARSVEVSEEKLTVSPNNGTTFTPYFLCINLWIAVLMSTFMFPYLLVPEGLSGSRQVSKILGKLAIPLAYSAFQALVLTVGMTILGVSYLHPLPMLVTSILSIWTYLMVVLALVFLAGDAGRLGAIVLLILQASSAGGSFPTELAGGFYRGAQDIMPMTASLRAFRYGLFGAYDGQFGALMLRLVLSFLVAFLLALLARRKWKPVPAADYLSPIKI